MFFASTRHQDIVNNYSFKVFPFRLCAAVPTVVVVEKMAKLFDNCPKIRVHVARYMAEA
jgi:hypothetical protein